MSATGDTVFTVTELVQRWRTTRKSVMSTIHEGRLHAFRVGSRVYRIAKSEVERFENEQTERTG